MLTAPGDLVEQVHVGGGYSDEVYITWVTNHTGSSMVVVMSADMPKKEFHGVAQSYSYLLDPSIYYPVDTSCRGSHNYTNPDCFYTSGRIHTVQVTGLKPSTKYEYEVADDKQVFSFTTPAAVDANAGISFAVVADLGQTENSSHTVKCMYDHVTNKSDVDMVLFAGDISYADGYGPRWDTYARAQEYLWANVPTAYVGGNHEVSNGGENWQSYLMRYPNNHFRSGSDSALWYSFEVASAHILMLCSYTDIHPGSPQYEWLEQDLAKIDRTKTPWLIGVWHVPFYTSNMHHPMTEGARMKTSMEALLHKYGVDIVFSGHVHAYERTFPVFDGAVNCSHGAVYITGGDGGNREQLAKPWTDVQPAWSAWREYAYGHGRFQIFNQTHAKWIWYRNDDPWNTDPKRAVGDQFMIVKGDSDKPRNLEKCNARINDRDVYHIRD
jgi:3',5'-cyclic AMP phosphodiesterase CpdA